MSEKPNFSNELFKDKNVPSFIRDHKLFKQQPVQVKKIFPSIGLPNFTDKVQIEKTLSDITREGGYVFNVMRAIHDLLTSANTNIINAADRFQYLENKESREANRERITKLYELAAVVRSVAECTDPYELAVITNAVVLTEDKKVVLKLINDIADQSGKTILRKGELLFRVCNKLRLEASSYGVVVGQIDQTEAFKIFSKENIPNKEYSIVFSSEGSDGAWDIATMSMRGIRSCQRWDGEYPRCLIGSILSKFVGIIYMTSGVSADNHPSFVGNLGSKMMRRCVVRYVVNADEGQPCILVDKMYPEHDKEIAALFINALKARTKLPVFYAADLGNKLRHFYLPTEKVRSQISDREASYQDHPLKSKNELHAYILFNNKEEIDREVKGFLIKYQIFLARQMEKDAETGSDNEIRRTLNNIKLNSSFTSFGVQLASYIVASFNKPPEQSGIINSKAYYRKYLITFLMKRKTTFNSFKPNLNALLQTSSTRTYDVDAFNNYLMQITVAFIKSEITNLSN